jgi:hypothetical protein
MIRLLRIAQTLLTVHGYQLRHRQSVTQAAKPCQGLVTAVRLQQGNRRNSYRFVTLTILLPWSNKAWRSVEM